jgi:hypothetical protein
MAKRLARIDFKTIRSGLFPGLDGDVPLFWKTGQNVLFTESGVRPLPSQWLLFNRSEVAPVQGIVSVWQGGEQVIFYGTPTKLYRWSKSSGLAVVGSGYHGRENSGSSGEATHWVFAKWGEWMLATNGVDPVQIYKGTSFADLSGPSFAKAKVIARSSPYLIAFGTDSSNANIEWCSDDDVEDWTPSATNTAGNLFVRDLDGPIVAAELVAENVVFYTGTQMGILQWVGGTDVFGQDMLLQGIGVVGPQALVSVNRQHYGFSKAGIFVTNGISSEFIDPPEVHDYIFGSINTDQLAKVVVEHWPQQQHVVVSYPSANSTSNDRAVGYNYKTGAWTVFNFSRSAADKGGVFGGNLAGDYLGNVWHMPLDGHVGGALTSGDVPFKVSATVGPLGYGIGGYGLGGYGGIINVN